MRNLAVLLAVIVPAAAGASPQGPEATLPGPVIYEVRSWGRILVRWQVNPDGTGEIWRRSEHKDSAELGKFRLRLEGHALRAFVTNATDAQEATRGGIPCKKDIFDLPYGSITWDYPGAKQVYAFDAGCRTEKGDEVQDILTAETTIVETMAKVDARPYIVEPAR